VTDLPRAHDVVSRAIGAVIGSAAGDALGAGYEFQAAPQPLDVMMLPGVLTREPAGHWTDDTAMAIAILEVAARNGTLTTPEASVAVGDRFLEWFRSDPNDVGGLTKAVLSQAATGADLPRVAAIEMSRSSKSAGNGSLMRTGPVALAHLGDDAQLNAAARAMSVLTHAHPDAVEACVLWTAAVDRAIAGSLEGPRAGLHLVDEGRREFWSARITEAEIRSPREFNPNGYVVTALQAAWSAIFATERASDHFEAGLRQAVAIGYDTDTVAAIAGALLGAYYGQSAIPPEWRRGLAGWPVGFGADELEVLAIQAERSNSPED